LNLTTSLAGLARNENSGEIGVFEVEKKMFRAEEFEGGL